MLQLVNHTVYTGRPLPPLSPSLLYEYYLAGNGLFLRAKRVGLEVLMPLCPYPVRGLADLEPYVKRDYELVPQTLVASILEQSRQAIGATGQPLEKLFHLSYSQSGQAAGGGRGNWQLEVPAQVATKSSVKPLESGPGSSYERAIIEVHSHHSMRAFFSTTDDRDEARSFRVFGVVGRIFDRPQMRLRIGVFGHFWQVRAEELLELPPDLHDCVAGREGAKGWGELEEKDDEEEDEDEERG